MTTVVITGVAGLLGSNLSRWIVENKKAKVIGIDNLEGGDIRFIPKEIEFHKLDITKDTKEINKLFENHKPEYVFHFAAFACEGLSPFMRKYTYTSNCVGTSEIVNQCIKHKVKRLVYTSSMAVYGKSNQEPPFNEDLVPMPEDSYGIAKYACEQDIKVAYKHHGLEYCIIRPHNVYGPQQNIWDRYRNVLGIWIYQLLNNLPITVYGDGEQKRAFSYIEDSLEPMWNGAVKKEAKNEIINVGGTEALSLNQVLEILKKVTGKEPKVEHLEQRYEVKNAWSTHEKSVEILQYKDNTRMEEGLKKMWEWAKLQPKKERKKWESYELEKGIYSYWK